MKKQSKATKLKLMRSVVRDLSDAQGGAINNTNTGGCMAGTRTKDRGNDLTCTCATGFRN
jgi:hypothetical protein